MDSTSPNGNMNFTMMSGVSSPNPGSMLVSFNFLAQQPIDEFIMQENSKASKMSARLRNTASMKISLELNRKIKEKQQRARLDKVLEAADIKVKTDVKLLKAKEDEKKAKVQAALENKRRAERVAQRQADKDRATKDE